MRKKTGQLYLHIIIKDTNELIMWENQRQPVEKHYIKKWGGLPNNESFNKPFTPLDVVWT